MNFDKLQKWFVALWVAGVVISIGLLGFAVWVVIRLLSYFGVI